MQNYCHECRVVLIEDQNWLAPKKPKPLNFCILCDRKLKRAKANEAARKSYARVRDRKLEAVREVRFEEKLERQPVAPRIASLFTPEVMKALAEPCEVRTFDLTNPEDRSAWVSARGQRRY